jgi:hypothetical protein
VPKISPPVRGQPHRRVNDGILQRLLVRKNFLRRLAQSSSPVPCQSTPFHASPQQCNPCCAAREEAHVRHGTARLHHAFRRCGGRAATLGPCGSRWRDVLRQKATLKSNSTISLTGPARRGTVRIGATNLLIARKVDPRLPRSTERPREPRGGEREKPRGSPRVSYGRRRAKLRGPSPSTEARVEGLFRRRRLPATTNVTHGSEQIDDQETDYRPHCFWRAHCSHRGHLCCRRCSAMVGRDDLRPCSARGHCSRHGSSHRRVSKFQHANSRLENSTSSSTRRDRKTRRDNPLPSSAVPKNTTDPSG